MQPFINSIIRALLALIGGVWGGSTDADLGLALRTFLEQLASGDGNAIGGSVVTLIAIGWSIYEKARAKKGAAK